ncbi:hypothetical protein NDU88_001911 [Pleurodeles waltl]|uniref:Uncharacterized protein n=1 Tax=Pleurodeles waltl TaxID=8319 RepID=A0AAV7U8Z4_PLEWA|nr:hypothetical protein NDU88_001911 [Pleurodeles waltl]
MATSRGLAQAAQLKRLQPRGRLAIGLAVGCAPRKQMNASGVMKAQPDPTPKRRCELGSGFFPARCLPQEGVGPSLPPPQD